MKALLISIIIVWPSILLSQGLVLKYAEEYPNNQYPYFRPDFRGYQGYYPFDLDDDGSIDMLKHDRQSQVTTLFRMPGMVPAWTTGELDFGWPIGFYDLTGDASKEIVFFAYDHTLRVFNLSTSQYIASLDSFVSIGTNWIVSDYDNDGIDDIFFTAYVDDYSGETIRMECWGVGQVTSLPPSSLTITAAGNDVALRWQEVDSCSMYLVEWSPNLLGEFAEIGRTCFTNFSHQGAALVNRAYYRVQAITSTNSATIIGTSTYSAKTRSHLNNK